MTAEELEQLTTGEYIVVVEKPQLPSFAALYNLNIGDELIYLYKSGDTFVFNKITNSRKLGNTIFFTTYTCDCIETKAKIRDSKLGSLGI